MHYNCRCEIHRQKCFPVYYRPDGKSHHRLKGIVYCPGINRNGHVCKEEVGLLASIAVPLDSS